MKPNYGYDAPKIMFAFGCASVFLTIAAIIFFYLFYTMSPLLSWLILLSFLTTACGTIYPVIAIFLGSRVFKMRERDWLLSLLNIHGEEQILDIGCGRGLLLIAVAKRLTTGKAIGIDIWDNADQYQNSPQATIENAYIEKVVDRVDIITADARKMPFEENVFDCVVSSWAIHNIPHSNEREKVLVEIKRVLKPGGVVALMDIETSHEYERFFRRNNFSEVQVLGPRYTFGVATCIVKAIKK